VDPKGVEMGEQRSLRAHEAHSFRGGNEMNESPDRRAAEIAAAREVLSKCHRRVGRLVQECSKEAEAVFTLAARSRKEWTAPAWNAELGKLDNCRLPAREWAARIVEQDAEAR
jgi:hypothetical protein